MDQSNSDEEDYMSDAFLSKCNDTRPGLVPDRVARQYQREVKHKTLNTVNREQNKPRKALETEKREEGLQNALSADNKGFKLLEKMGYKPGMAIGKTGVGRTEPIPMTIKTCRSGLGEATERKRKVVEQRAMRVVMAQKRQKHEQEWKQNIRAKVVSRELERDLFRSQKVCVELDSQQGLEIPQQKFYWPPEYLPHNEVDEDDDEQDKEEEEEEDEDESLTEAERLQLLTHYLRSTYHYCVWCGTAFNDDADMISNCPGDTAEDHG